MRCHRALIFGLMLLGLGASEALGQDNANLDSLRLGSRYLRWAPAKDGDPAPGATAPAAIAPAPMPPTAAAPAAFQPQGISLAQWEALAEQQDRCGVYPGLHQV